MHDQMKNIYRLVWHVTNDDNKWKATYHREYLGSAESILALWAILTKSMWRYMDWMVLCVSQKWELTVCTKRRTNRGMEAN